MITLAHLRALLERALTHAENPAIVRLADRTVEGVARAYLPRWLPWVKEARETALMLEWAVQVYGKATLDLTEPGTAHALLVALALTLGLDPGVGGLDCSWCRDAGEGYARWLLRCAVAPEPRPDRALFDAQSEADDDSLIGVRVVAAPTVAAEHDPLKALVLAALHVLEHP